MAGKQAKVLSDTDVSDLLAFARRSRNPTRNEVILLLSAKAGLRAGEIANLTWDWSSTHAASSASPSSCITMQPRTAAAASFQYTQIFTARLSFGAIFQPIPGRSFGPSAAVP